MKPGSSAHNRTIRKPSDVEIAWFAGFFDGEGSIFISPRKRVTILSQHVTTTYHLRLSIANTDPAALAKCKDIWDAGHFMQHDGKTKKPNHRLSWVWRAETVQAAKILYAVLPYLVTKRLQAEIALSWWDERAKRPAVGRKMRDLAWDEIDETARLAVSKMKHRGVDNFKEALLHPLYSASGVKVTP